MTMLRRGLMDEDGLDVIVTHPFHTHGSPALSKRCRNGPKSGGLAGQPRPRGRLAAVPQGLPRQAELPPQDSAPVSPQDAPGQVLEQHPDEVAAAVEAGQFPTTGGAAPVIGQGLRNVQAAVAGELHTEAPVHVLAVAHQIFVEWPDLLEYAAAEQRRPPAGAEYQLRPIVLAPIELPGAPVARHAVPGV